MDMVNVVSLFALLFSLAGNALINFRKRFGFVIWIASNVLWIVVNFMGKPNWSQIAMFVAYMALNVHGLVTWGNEGRKRG